MTLTSRWMTASTRQSKLSWPTAALFRLLCRRKSSKWKQVLQRRLPWSPLALTLPLCLCSAHVMGSSWFWTSQRKNGRWTRCFCRNGGQSPWCCLPSTAWRKTWTAWMSLPRTSSSSPHSCLCLKHVPGWQRARSSKTSLWLTSKIPAKLSQTSLPVPSWRRSQTFKLRPWRLSRSLSTSFPKFQKLPETGAWRASSGCTKVMRPRKGLKSCMEPLRLVRRSLWIPGPSCHSSPAMPRSRTPSGKSSTLPRCWRRTFTKDAVWQVLSWFPACSWTKRTRTWMWIPSWSTATPCMAPRLTVCQASWKNDRQGHWGCQEEAGWHVQRRPKEQEEWEEAKEGQKGERGEGGQEREEAQKLRCLLGRLRPQTSNRSLDTLLLGAAILGVPMIWDHRSREGTLEIRISRSLLEKMRCKFLPPWYVAPKPEIGGIGSLDNLGWYNLVSRILNLLACSTCFVNLVPQTVEQLNFFRLDAPNLNWERGYVII